MEDHKCAICDEIHYQSKDNKRPKKVNKAPVGASMKNTLIKKSKNKNDGKWEKWQNEDIYIHENCRALYYKDPRKMSLSSAEVPSDTSTTTFSIFDSSTDDEHDNDFDFKVSCIFCAKKWSSQEGQIVQRSYQNKRILDVVQTCHESSIVKIRVCPSYYHLRLYEASVLLDPPKLIINEAYSQYVFDNTDHNVITIDGESKKLSKMPPSSQIASVNEIPDVNLPIDCKGNIDKITFEDTNKLNLGNSDYLPLHYTTYLWLKHLNFSGIPSWHGFLEKMYGEEISHSTSRVMCLPFINHKATEYLSIHTALTYSIQQAKKNNQIIVFVTFDLPLYKIARDICTSLQDTDLKYVYVRLGGFHMLMSYLGGIGNIMEGSGLSELWSTVYAPKSVKHLLAGHAFTRSVRANILTYTALGHLICEQIDKDKVKELKDYLNELFNDIDQDPYNGPYIGDCNSDDNICKMNEKFIQELKRLKYYGPTAKLWIQYFECITIMLQYIEAERTGNWMLYLQSVKKMLPLFHASGHFLYARCAQLYLQDMASLEKNMTVEEYNKFTRDGYFTVHRTDKCFNAVWTDMSIEQTLNRFFGTDLVHGRGVTDSVISRYLGAMPTCYMIMENLEDFCNVKTQNSEQHIQLLKARIKLDNDHLEIFKSWFTKHDSLIQRTSIVSLSTGVMGGSEINCYEAIKKGEENMVNMIGENSKTFSFNRLMLVKNLASAKKRAHLSGKHESVDPLEFFRVISSSLQKLPASGLKNILKHELSPYPLSLFNKKGFMRQCDQNIYDIIKKTYNFVDNFVHDLTIILDGDFLLDAVSSWPQCRTFKIICDLYLDYIKKKFNSQIEMKRLYIVFHLYHNEVCGVKSYNQLRQSEKSIAADFDLDYDALCSMTKKQFLSNVCNKQKFVLMLQEYLKNTANVRMVDEDCTEAIVKEAVQLATQYSNPVGVVTNNVEPLLLLITQCPTSLRRYIYYCKYNHEGKPMEINPIYLFDDCRSFILFCHVFGGCESTSDTVQLFYKPNSSVFNICEATERIFVCLYNTGKTQSSIDELRYTQFTKLQHNPSVEQRLASLPPSKSAAHEHGKRVYYQMQTWLGNSLELVQWGWKRYQMTLIPIMTDEPPAPEQLCEMISCGCTMKCQTTKCKCKKTGLPCSTRCKGCQGIGCANASNNCNIFLTDRNETNEHLEEDEERDNVTVTDEELWVTDKSDVYGEIRSDNETNQKQRSCFQLRWSDNYYEDDNIYDEQDIGFINF
ncbi:hypothetical protein HCN44_010405 [Aphidius gifuensis]|uniref:Tesmin/TSO1-like CXC domain-containing protein n=1 Tax=Aphidius gifuensis TaxID=684658 RepID=A0A834Y796_APHGI|nr:hypothetical protein HCN44_010405 [Aphidius gifuensis]